MKHSVMDDKGCLKIANAQDGHMWIEHGPLHEKSIKTYTWTLNLQRDKLQHQTPEPGPKT